MFTNTQACTIYEKTVQNRAPVYLRHVTGAVYWEERRGQVQSDSMNSDTSRKQQRSVLCLIPAASVQGYLPKKDDRMVVGVCALTARCTPQPSPRRLLRRLA